MVTKVHEKFEAGQFLTGSLNHMEVVKAGMVEADLKVLVETIGTRATVVILGEVGVVAVDTVRICIENNEAWADIAELEAALLAASGDTYTITAFDY